MQLAGLGAALQIVGTIGSTIAGVMQARSAAKASEAEAESIREQARIAEDADRRRSRIIMAKQQARVAAAGLDVSTGSPLEFQLDSAREAAMNALNIRYTGELQRRSKLFEAGQARGAIPGIILGGAGQLGGVIAKNQSVLGDWWKKARGVTVPA